VRAAKCPQGPLHTTQNAVSRIAAAAISDTGDDPGQEFDSLLRLAGGVDMKAPLGHCLHQSLVEHQMAGIAGGYQDPLAAIQADAFAETEPALDLLVDAADRQHLAMLVQRAGDGDALLQRQPGK